MLKKERENFFNPEGSFEEKIFWIKGFTCWLISQNLMGLAFQILEQDK
jgi:hypothetical protein